MHTTTCTWGRRAARLTLSLGLSLGPSLALPGVGWAAGPALPQALLQTAHQRPVSVVAFSPDAERFLSGSTDGVRVFQASYGRILAYLPHDRQVVQAAFSGDGKQVVTVTEDRKVRVFEVATGKRLLEGEAPTSSLGQVPVAASFGPEGLRIAVGEGATLKLLTTDGQQVKPVAALKLDSAVDRLGFSLDGRMLAVATTGKVIHLVEPGKGKLQADLKGHQTSLRHLHFSADRSLLLSASFDGEAALWDLKAGKVVSAIQGAREGATLGPQGQLLSADKAGLQLKDRSGKPVKQTPMALKAGEVSALALSPEGRRVAAGSSDGTVWVWDLSGQEPALYIRNLTSPLVSLAASPDGQRFATHSEANLVRMYDAQGKAAAFAEGTQSLLASLRYLPDGKLAGTGEATRLWDREGRPVGKKDGVSAPGAVSPDGSLVALLGPGRAVLVQELASGKVRHTLSGHQGPVNALAISPDGKLLASTGARSDGIKLWDLASGKVQSTFPLERDADLLAFSPDGKTLAVGSGEDIRLVSTAAPVPGQAVLAPQVLKGHTQTVKSLTFTADGKHLLSGGADGTVRRWEVAGGKLLTTAEGHQGEVRGVVQLGQAILSAGADATLRVWDDKGQLALLVLPLAEREALLLAPDGRYELSSRSAELLAAFPEGTPVKATPGLWCKAVPGGCPKK